MQMGEGVEWALHSCLNLAWAEADGAGVGREACGDLRPAARVPQQAAPSPRPGRDPHLVLRAAGAGSRLARDLADITVMDVVAAIEGRQEAFRCPGDPAGLGPAGARRRRLPRALRDLEDHAACGTRLAPANSPRARSPSCAPRSRRRRRGARGRTDGASPSWK
ncbi:hypothetical protein ACU686_35875 [Yinghuangia aomiensis]